MRLVVADTTPLNYLVLIGLVEALPALFEKIFVPQVVTVELRHAESPADVRRWIESPPPWIEIVPDRPGSDAPDLVGLDEGERAAILLAADLKATFSSSTIATA